MDYAEANLGQEMSGLDERFPKVSPDVAWVNSWEYGKKKESSRSWQSDVDPAPLIALVAAALGLRSDLTECKKAIAEDDEDGPIHLVHLLAACDVAARELHGGLPTNASVPANLGTGFGISVATSASPHVLPSLVVALRRDGLVGATTLARSYTRRERYRALGLLVELITGPIGFLSIDLHDRLVRTNDPSSPSRDDTSNTK